jgi:hypothetical protein
LLNEFSRAEVFTLITQQNDESPKIIGGTMPGNIVEKIPGGR